MLEQNAVWLAAAFLFSWVGFGLLALAQERHTGLFYPSFKPVAQVKQAQAAIGIIAICIAFALCIKTQSAGFGSLLWLLMLTASAMMVALQLTWAPQTLKPLAWLVKRFFHDSFYINDPR